MMQFGSLTLKRCKYGWMLYTGPIIGKCFDLYGQYSEAEVAMLRRFLREGGVAIDVGASIGDLTIPMAQMLGNAGRVFAIESHPEIYNVLCANLALNGVANTKPINAFVAASESVDMASAFWGPHAFIGTTWRPNVLAIDSLDLPACDLIKIDVDGKEQEVLASGEMQIERFRPILYFENDVREASSRLLAFAGDTLGYDLYWHVAPVFEEKNYFGNPTNHWAPKNICSIMVLGIPSERKLEIDGLRRVRSSDEWLEPQGNMRGEWLVDE